MRRCVGPVWLQVLKASAAASAATWARPGTVPPAISKGRASRSSSIVRQVLPSVVLIRTGNGLGSGVVLDRSGNVVEIVPLAQYLGG